MKKFLSIFLVLAMFLTALCFAGCKQTVLEDGFCVSGGCLDIGPMCCAYRSNTDEFNIDDVTLEFFYGGDYHEDLSVALETFNYPFFELFFKNDEGYSVCVKRVDENLVSEKYRCKIHIDKNNNPVTFCYSEMLTIPQEIFSKEKGFLWFTISGTNISEISSQHGPIASIRIYYKTAGNKVVLSSKELK